VRGKWTYLYRAVDSQGDTLDFMLSECRDEDAASAKQDFPRLPILILADGLYPNTAYLREIPYELMASRALLRGFLSSG
jgi:putative transposase